MNEGAKLSQNKGLIAVLILVAFCGTALCGWNLILTFQQDPLTLLGVLSSVIQFAAYLAILVFALYTNRMEGKAPFQGVVLAFAALLGIQLLQAGRANAGFGLSEDLTLMINAFNLIAFANVIMFSNRLDNKRSAIGYMLAAVALKLVGELILIIKLWEFVNFEDILLSLSVPVLGLLVLLAYHTFYRSEK